MAKRTTDLFEVFQPRPSGGASAPRKPRAKGRKKPAGGSRRKQPFEGIFLNPRQVLLASCVLALLMVLAFTLGLGVGRRGDGANDPSLSVTTGENAARFYIRGQMPREDIATGRPNDPDEIHRELVQRWRFRPSDVRVTEGDRDHYWVFYGPFRTQTQAGGVLIRRKLGAMPVGNSFPFTFAEIVEEKP